MLKNPTINIVKKRVIRLMQTTQIARRIEDLRRSLSKKGDVNTSASATLLSILGVIRRIEKIEKIIRCISANKKSCIDIGKGNLCRSECSNAFILELDGEKRIWRIGGNAFGSNFSEDKIKIGIKDLKIEVYLDKISVGINGSTLDTPTNAKEIAENSYLITSVANKIDSNLRNALMGLAECAKSLGLRC